eukprot:TRINITY_DN3046_c0_g1_i1.p1 TRINITY_DN3046_c0_g1~~TRINITY_DN3046_c0_g1_i1.p1  ORF type:complete len:565 (+),score=112.29 TRINITY_DN3046_c0_g1_i1:928-2622(+)
MPLNSKDALWYKDAVVYCLYVDLFAGNFTGLTKRLAYLQNLGVTCLWLLPILSSPMKDAGFDVDNYYMIRDDLLDASEQDAMARQRHFDEFITEAHSRGIAVVFDIAINHVSVDHAWFRSACESRSSPYRDFFIWSDTQDALPHARIIFKGIEDSNWAPTGDQFYIHRFFSHQPDLNYRNPSVLEAVTDVLMFWLRRGVDGFRADAVPFVWKEDGTNCEGLPQVHSLLRFFRAMVDYVQPSTMLLAEACQPPHDVVKYFGSDDECQTAYHFPLMPRIFCALATQNRWPIQHTLLPEVTPPIPPLAQWFTFLRVHDELTLEMVSTQERQLLYSYFCRDKRWDFRQGEGISARLYELMEGNTRRILMAYSIMFSLMGTPVLFYGDEFCKPNDEGFYAEQVALTGIHDSRYYNRGRVDWNHVNGQLQDETSHASLVHSGVRAMAHARAKFKSLGRGELRFLDPLVPAHMRDMIRAPEQMSLPGFDSSFTLGGPSIQVDNVLMYQRVTAAETLLVINNLSGEPVQLDAAPLSALRGVDILGQALNVNNDTCTLIMQPYEYRWIQLPSQ